MKLSLVVPVYGSEKILEKAHKEFTKAVKSVTNDYELLFRIDDSPDNSEQVLKKIISKDKKVKIFSHKPNKGLGYTLRKLFQDAKGDYIVYFDADAFLSFDLEMFPVLFKKTKTSDAVIASRYVKSPQVPFYRHFASEIYSLINNTLFGIRIRDIGSGFVIFKKKAIRNINLTSDGFDIHIEIYSKLARKKYKIEEVPATYKHWRGGSFKVFKHGPKTLLNTILLGFRMLMKK